MIASGLKNSTVFLHDVRSQGTATRLQHPHAVSKIRKVDSYRLVVAGQKSVCKILQKTYSLNTSMEYGTHSTARMLTKKLFHFFFFFF